MARSRTAAANQAQGGRGCSAQNEKTTCNNSHVQTHTHIHTCARSLSLLLNLPLAITTIKNKYALVCVCVCVFVCGLISNNIRVTFFFMNEVR